MVWLDKLAALYQGETAYWTPWIRSILEVGSSPESERHSNGKRTRIRIFLRKLPVCLLLSPNLQNSVADDRSTPDAMVGMRKLPAATTGAAAVPTESRQALLHALPDSRPTVFSPHRAKPKGA